jgi:hypothetical protein
MLDDLLQRNIGIGHPRAYFDQRPLAIAQLSDPLGNQVDEDRSVWNDFRGFLEEITGHSSVLTARFYGPRAEGTRKLGQ